MRVSEEVGKETLKCCKQIEKQVNRYSRGKFEAATFYFKLDPVNRLHLVSVKCICVKDSLFKGKPRLVKVMPDNFKAQSNENVSESADSVDIKVELVEEDHPPKESIIKKSFAKVSKISVASRLSAPEKESHNFAQLSICSQSPRAAQHLH